MTFKARREHVVNKLLAYLGRVIFLQWMRILFVFADVSEVLNTFVQGRGFQ